MKKTIAILGGILGVASLASGEELSISSTLAWESDYIFRGVRLADEYAAPSVDVSYGGFYAGVWAALPFEDDEELESEVDLYGGYSFGINETLSADVGLTYYTYTNGDWEDTIEIYGGLSFEVPLSPAVYVFYDDDLETFTIEASGGYTIEVDETSSIDLSAYVGYVDPDEGDDYLYYGAGAAYVYTFTDNASASVGVNYYGTDADDGLVTDSSKGKFTLAASFTAGF
jgi:uncharacterized protein (TIGR02001 family)